MYKTINLLFTIILVFSSQANASLVKLYGEANGSLGHSITHNVDGVEVKIDAYYYDKITREVFPGVVVGIDGEANSRHPAGIGIGKSATSVNPPGLDNVGGMNIGEVFHDYLEFLVFSFDSAVKVVEVETDGLGPHGTSVEYWSGANELNWSRVKVGVDDNGNDVFTINNSDDLRAKIDELGDRNIFIDTAGDYYSDPDVPVFPGFKPDAEGVSWFAIGAMPEEAFNVFSIQAVQFTAAASPAPVPVPSAFWLFLTAALGLVRRKGV